STAALEVETDNEVTLFDEDVTSRVQVLHRHARHVALRGPGMIVVCVGSTHSGTVVVPIRLRGVLDPSRRYAIGLFNSERDSWEFSDERVASSLDDLSVVIEAGGFRVIALQEEA
ncbi:MAG TPA: hypothetical protein VF818_01240, partial [Ktedonobacterales bacterium]